MRSSPMKLRVAGAPAVASSAASIVVALSVSLAAATAQAEEPKPRAAEKPTPPIRALGRIIERPGACKPLAPDTPVRLELDDVAMPELLREVARVTCRGFLVDEALTKLRMHVVSGGEIRADQLWGVVLASLQLHGAATVDRGPYTAVIPATDGARAPIPTLGPADALPAEERMVTKMYRLRGAHDHNAVVNFLNIFKSGKGQIHPYYGLIVATDFTSSLRRMEALLAELEREPPPTTKR